MKNYFFIFSLIFFVSSCKVTNNINTTSKIIQNIKSKKLEKLIKQNDFKHDYFSSKVRVLYNKQTFTAHLRMKKDSIIWLSLTGPFNIEGARVKITQNRVEMINKLNGTYYNEPLSFIKNFIPLDVDFNTLQQLILGNFIEKGIKKQKIDTKDQKYIVEGNLEGFKLLYLLLPNGKIDNLNIASKNDSKKINVHYSKYEKFDNQDFSLRRNFLIKESDKENLVDLKFYKMKTEKLTFPFKVPSSYNKK